MYLVKYYFSTNFIQTENTLLHYFYWNRLISIYDQRRLYSSFKNHATFWNVYLNVYKYILPLRENTSHMKSTIVAKKSKSSNKMIIDARFPETRVNMHTWKKKPMIYAPKHIIKLISTISNYDFSIEKYTWIFECQPSLYHAISDPWQFP